MGKSKSKPFEQAFLEKAFTVSVESDTSNCDIMLRSLKSLLVQKGVRQKMQAGEKTAEDYLIELRDYESRPCSNVQADIYQVCGWLKRGVSRVIIWKAGIPGNSVLAVELKADMQDILDRLTLITGDLCEILDVQIVLLGTKQFTYPKFKEPTDGGKAYRQDS